MENGDNDIFVQSGNWLIVEFAKLINDIKIRGLTQENTKRITEIKGRIGQWKRDLDKIY